MTGEVERLHRMYLDFDLLRQPGSKALLAESPYWDPGTDDVWWVDIDGRKLFLLDAQSGEIRNWITPECPGFVVLAGPGRPAVGMETGIFSFDPKTSGFERIVVFDRPGQRFNDATVSGDGRLWTSTMALDGAPGCGAIQTVTRGMKLNTVVEGLTIPNGLAVDGARGRLFYSDSHPDVQTVWVRKVEGNPPVVGRASRFTRTTILNGRPDGAALDERGFYWIAGVDGSELYIFDLDGRLDTVIPVPFPAPTKVSFRGAGGRALAVTSKGIGENGGFMALADLPQAAASGITQPYWSAAA